MGLFAVLSAAAPQLEVGVRQVYLIIVVVLAVATFTFSVQNLEIVTLSFLGFAVRAPLAVITAIIYVVGALTGAGLLAFVRKSVEASKGAAPQTP